MRGLNFIGNKFFSMAFSWLLGQHLKDTLCGTKVLWRKDYELIAANRSYFGDFDPFGDFDLLSRRGQAEIFVADLPIRYRERTYGSTNIALEAWLAFASHGLVRGAENKVCLKVICTPKHPANGGSLCDNPSDYECRLLEIISSHKVAEARVCCWGVN